MQEIVLTDSMINAVPVLNNHDVERYGWTYRTLCRQQGNSILMKDSKVITFAEFVILQNTRKEVDLLASRFKGSRRAAA